MIDPKTSHGFTILEFVVMVVAIMILLAVAFLMQLQNK